VRRRSSAHGRGADVHARRPFRRRRAAGVAGLFVATGCCAHGIAGAGGVGRALAEAVTGEAATLDPGPMAPGRFGAQAWDALWFV